MIAAPTDINELPSTYDDGVADNVQSNISCERQKAPFREAVASQGEF